MFSGSSCTRRAEVEGLAQGLVLAAQGGAESLAPGPAPGRDQGPGPDRCLAVPGPGLGRGLMAGTDPEAEADHEMLKESNKNSLIPNQTFIR